MYPILFEFSVITVFSLWFFIALGFVAGAMLFIKLAKRGRLRLTLLSENSVSLFLWTLAVSRITFIIFHPDYYFYRFQLKNLFSMLAIWDKGFSFWGAVFAWTIGLWYLSTKRKENKENLLKMFDLMSPALLLGMALGNIGAFLDGINYGTPTSLPWGMVFRSANVKYITQIHPTQLYGTIYVFLAAVLLLYLLKKLRGSLTGFASEITIFLFSLFKFFEEFIRGDETIKIFGVRLPQLLALAGLLVSAYLIRQRYLNKTGGDPEGMLKNFVRGFIKKLRKSNPPESKAASMALQNQTT